MHKADLKVNPDGSLAIDLTEFGNETVVGRLAGAVVSGVVTAKGAELKIAIKVMPKAGTPPLNAPPPVKAAVAPVAARPVVPAAKPVVPVKPAAPVVAKV